MTGAPTVPWSDLSEVRLMMLRPQLLFGGRRHQIVAFLPRPGAQLPGPPGLRGRPYAWFASKRERVYGTNLLVSVAATDASAVELADAARRLGGLPLRAEPIRPVRRWLILLGGAAAAGVLAAIVITLLEFVLGY